MEVGIFFFFLETMGEALTLVSKMAETISGINISINIFMEEVYQSDWNAPCQDTCPMPSSTALAHVNFPLSFSLLGVPNLTLHTDFGSAFGVKDA